MNKFLFLIKTLALNLNLERIKNDLPGNGWHEPSLEEIYSREISQSRSTAHSKNL